MKDILLILMLCLSIAAKATVHADFTPDKTQGCPPLLVNFTNLSTPANAGFRWDFGNGNSSILANPSAMFLNAGNYRVKLMVTYGGVTDTISKVITVHQLPVVNFSAPAVDLCSNDTARFLANVVPGDAAITDYAWGFGDGIASSDINSKHVYNQAGTYDVTLVVQDANGCSNNVTKHNYIQTFPAPNASFTAVPAISCNYTDTVHFTNNSIGNGLSYLWKLNDTLTTTITNPYCIYTQERRKVVLYVTDQNGCKDSIAFRISVTDIDAGFVANKTEACAGESIKFTSTSPIIGTGRFWDFGDGTTSTSTNPTKVYSNPGIYTVKLTAIDGPCRDTLVKVNYITITTGFAVSFTADATQGCETPFTVNFSNNTPGGATFNWTFGDGTTSNAENPSKTFTTNGTFSVSLTVTDTTGCSVTGVVPAMVSTSLPRPRFKSDTLGCPGNGIAFNNISLDAVSYMWNFGDGDTSSVKSPNHIFDQVGDYTVTLTAFNSLGCDSSITKVVHIDTVHVDFAVNQTFSPCPPFVALFTSNANKPNLKYFWDFGDGGTDTAANPTHIYFYPGIYTVKMVGKTAYGCTDTIVYKDLIVVQGPSGVFAVNPTEGCVPLNVNFSAVVSTNTLSFWSDMGDGRVVNDSLAFSHAYTQVDSFHPKFILVDHIGCMVSYNLPVVVTHATPQLQLNDTTVCPGAVVLVDAGNDNYQWIPAANLSCDTCATVVINPQQTITYRVTATNQYGCNVVDSMSVNVQALPILNNPAP
ncbi:MAG: PKD domain-containing protein, partial [Chitinophagales bacterium]